MYLYKMVYVVVYLYKMVYVVVYLYKMVYVVVYLYIMVYEVVCLYAMVSIYLSIYLSVGLVSDSPSSSFFSFSFLLLRQLPPPEGKYNVTYHPFIMSDVLHRDI